MDFLVYRSYQRRFGKAAEKSVGIVRLENCKPLVCLKRLAAQSTGIVEEKVGQVLDEFECRGWLAKETADMDDGPVLLYRPTYKEYFIFFLFFARDMTVSPQFWYLSNCTRRKAPLLRDLPADARAEH